MYFFYLDESGSRDPSVGTPDHPKDLGYNVYRAFREENFEYPYFSMLLPSFYRRKEGRTLNGLKVWPRESPLIEKVRSSVELRKNEPSAEGG